VRYCDSRGQLEGLSVLALNPSQSVPVSEQHYVIHAPIQKVFEAYCTAKPHHMWPAHRIEFRFCTVPENDMRYGPPDEIPPVQQGMQMFCDLKVKPLGRYLSIMVGVEVTQFIPNREIRYDDLQGAVTRGFNRMSFSEERTSDGNAITHVHHYSEYQATSPVLRFFFPILQPLLHVGFVNELHGGMKQRIEA
jgi:hypothetical protein